MDISVLGLGYVGAVSAACFAQLGHNIIGVDPYQPKVDLINRGRTPVIEKDLDKYIEEAVQNGRLRATTATQEAVLGSEISIICVGTPSQANGSLDLKFVRNVCRQIGAVLMEKADYHLVVVRSTMLPGSMVNVVIPALEDASGKRAGVDFGLCINPEFLREGTAVQDFYSPPKTVIGEIDNRSGDALTRLYESLDAPMVRTDLETAEMVKYSDNVWHALKVGFANEIGNICKAVGIDGHKVMDIFCQDDKLNLSPCYLRPGFAFGGSCLPKDVRALTYKAKTLDLEVPILSAILPSNQRQVERGLRMILEKKNKKIGILGFSFKAGTDDLRESPMVEVIERLLGKGYDVQVFDRNVNISCLVGANRDYILNHIPHISNLMVDSIEQVLEHADTIVIGNAAEEFRTVLERAGQNQVVVDLVRILPQPPVGDWYEGICW